MMTELKIIITDGDHVPFVNVAGQPMTITATPSDAPAGYASSVGQVANDGFAGYAVSVTPVQVIYITRDQLNKFLDSLKKAHNT